MKITSAEIADSPALYPHTFEAADDRILFVCVSSADYRAASFLDARLLAPGIPTAWCDFAFVAEATRAVASRRLHFIFHAGHVGSTLLSRLLDGLSGVLGLREPEPARILARMLDDGVAPEGFERRLDVFLRLWSRGFADTEAVIVKLTSAVGRAAPVFLAAAPEARGIYLNLSAESYITAILAGSDGRSDLAVFEAHRARRLEKLLGEAVEKPATSGELAAIAWLVERGAQVAAEETGKVLAVDFESLLADLEPSLARVAAHLGLDAPPEAIGALAKSRVLFRYSKTPGKLAFSSAQRATLMYRAHIQYREDILMGMQLLQRLAARHKIAAELLNA